METRARILSTGLTLLGTVGARQCSARAVEDASHLPHGSVRHHFGSQAGLLEALVDHLLELDAPRPGEDLETLSRRWLTKDRVLTRARYELTLVALRTPRLRARMSAARDTYVTKLQEQGIDAATGRALVAMLDGMILDALLRDRDSVDLTHLPPVSVS